MTSKQIWERLEETKRLLDWEYASREAKDWWFELEELNRSRIHLVLRLARELAKRGATIQDFFIVCSHSRFVSVEENLRYLDQIQQDKERAIMRIDYYEDDVLRMVH